MHWISVNNCLLEDRTIVWIYLVYEDSAYDNVKDRVSVGAYSFSNKTREIISIVNKNLPIIDYNLISKLNNIDHIVGTWAKDHLRKKIFWASW